MKNGLLEWLVKGHQARCPVCMSTASYGYYDDVTVEVDYTMCNPRDHAANVYMYSQSHTCMCIIYICVHNYVLPQHCTSISLHVNKRVGKITK